MINKLKNKKIQKLVISFLVINLVVLFGLGFAQAQELPDKPTEELPDRPTVLVNPLKGDIDDIPTFVEKLFNIVLMIAVPVIAIAIIYAGFLFVKARGNYDAIKDAKKTLTSIIIGAAIVLGAWVIASAIQGTIDEIKAEIETSN